MKIVFLWLWLLLELSLMRFATHLRTKQAVEMMTIEREKQAMNWNQEQMGRDLRRRIFALAIRMIHPAMFNWRNHQAIYKKCQSWIIFKIQKIAHCRQTHQKLMRGQVLKVCRRIKWTLDDPYELQWAHWYSSGGQLCCHIDRTFSVSNVACFNHPWIFEPVWMKWVF